MIKVAFSRQKSVILKAQKIGGSKGPWVVLVMLYGSIFGQQFVNAFQQQLGWSQAILATIIVT